MVFFHLARLSSVVYVFLYPGYGIYKTLNARPVGPEEQQAHEAEKKRWLEYWSVMAFVLSAEYAAEWLVSWFPGYWLFKSIFLLWLVAPQTQGATFFFQIFLAPWLAKHEPEIDERLNGISTSIVAAVQNQFGQLLAIVLPSIPLEQQQQQQGQPGQPAPASFAAGAMLGLLQQYGPSLLSGALQARGAAQHGANQSAPGTPAANGTASGFELRPEAARARSSASGVSFPVPEIPVQ